MIGVMHVMLYCRWKIPVKDITLISSQSPANSKHNYLHPSNNERVC